MFSYMCNCEFGMTVVHTHLISVYTDCIILASACRTAWSKPFASQSQAMVAGARHMAQSGSGSILAFNLWVF